MVGRGLGGAYDHIKAFGTPPIPKSKGMCTEGLLGRHTCGRSLAQHTLYVSTRGWSYVAHVRALDLPYTCMCRHVIMS